MPLEPSPARGGDTATAIHPSYTINEFCRAERMSRAELYKLWKQGSGPDFYLVGTHRRISHQARVDWQQRNKVNI
jgi:hypothetical protein